MAKSPGLGERACPKCKETIKVEAEICKHCGARFSAEELRQAKEEQKSRAKMAGWGCLGVVFALGFCTYMVGGDSTPSNLAEKPSATAKTDAVAFFQTVSEIMAPCDDAGKAVASSKSDVQLYRAAKAMKSACYGIGVNVRGAKVPESVGKEHYDQLVKARDVCDNVSLMRGGAASELVELLENPGSIAQKASLEEATEGLQAGVFACAAGLMGPALALGATEAEMRLAASK